jgi:hypothetical protein
MFKKYKKIKFPFVELEPDISGKIYGTYDGWTYFDGEVIFNEHVVDGKKYPVKIESCTQDEYDMIARLHPVTLGDTIPSEKERIEALEEAIIEIGGLL